MVEGGKFIFPSGWGSRLSKESSKFASRTRKTNMILMK